MFLIDSQQKLEPIRQSYEIRRLRAELDELRKLASDTQTAAGPFQYNLMRNDKPKQSAIGPLLAKSSQGNAITLPNRKQTALEKVIGAIAAGSDDIVNNIVHQIRTGIGLEDIIAFIERGQGSLLKPAHESRAEGRKHRRSSNRGMSIITLNIKS